jgi:hypothetical protein
VKSFIGDVGVEWDDSTVVTPFGQMIFFIEYLQVSGLYEAWVNEFPLQYNSGNACSKNDILGTLLLSVLSGQTRYSHISSLRSEGVNSELLGMNKVVSEDTVRRSFAAIDENEGTSWMQSHLENCYLPLLSEPWILDIDTTIKPLYGRQEGAVVGYNPRKPGRPSHCYHTYMMANLRLILDVEVTAGDEHSSVHGSPGLWALLDRLPPPCRPSFIRGDKGFGNDKMMIEAEARNIDYLFKLRCTTNVKKLICKLMKDAAWEKAGHGFEGAESSLQLSGWERSRRVVVLRRRLKTDEMIVALQNPVTGQQSFTFPGTTKKTEIYEYAVMVTSLDEENYDILTLASQYRDRADSENVFDEMKNQWTWGGFTTHDMKRCGLMARTTALIYNWWSLYCRLSFPDKHTEALTSRPLMLAAVGKLTKHAGKLTLKITAMHRDKESVKQALTKVAQFLARLRRNAEQLSKKQIWMQILSAALVKYLKGKILSPPQARLTCP